MRDQTERVYRWERQWMHWNIRANSTAHVPRAWARWACKMYKIPAPVVRALKPGSSSYYRWPAHDINLIPHHLNIPSTLHEAAHAITAYRHGSVDHGPKWLGIYMHLLERAGVAPRAALRASARSAGLKFSTHVTPACIARKRLRKPRA